MLSMLKSWPGEVEVNGQHYNSIREALKNVSPATLDNLLIKLLSKQAKAEREQKLITEEVKIQYKIQVKSYMTQKATPEFDFMQVWNNNVPMPLCIMVGTKEKETRGMVYMKLHGELTDKITTTCLRCGKPITNPVSQYFGLGPICGGHNYVNPFASEDELSEAVAKYKEEVISKMTWEGWIIKSAIIDEEVVR